MKKKGFVIGGLIILAGAAGAGGWYYYKENYGDSAAASGEVAYVTKIQHSSWRRFRSAEPVRRRGRTSGDGKGKY